MIEIEVSRFPGDKKGPAIVDPLIRSEAGARERGQGEIDANGYDALIVAGTGPLRSHQIEPGALIENMDTEQEIWRGQVERSAITITKTKDSFTSRLALEVERVEEV